MDVSAVLLSAIPSGITAFCFWMIEHRIQRREEKDKEERAKRQKEVDERQARREEFEVLTLQAVSATMELSEATARAVQRIPEAHCNGDMDAALEYTKQAKRAKKDFLDRQGIANIYQ